MFGGSGKRGFLRTEISLTERVIGLVALALIAGIGVAVYLKGQHYDPALFALDTEALAREEPARAQVHLFDEEQEAAEGAAKRGQEGGLLEGLEMEGWRQLGAIETFDADNLYVKINGRAEQYLAYDVVGMECVGLADSSGRFLDVFAYDMGGPVRAFGIFSVERPNGVEAVGLGREGYRSGASYFFWKGQYYVQVIASDQGEEVERAGLEVARKLAERLPDRGEAVWGLEALPEEDRVPGTVQYFMRDALSLDFLTETFTARYRKGGQELTVFLSQQATPGEAARVMEKYLEYLAEYGQLVARQDQGGALRATGDLGGFFDVVFQQGRLVGGVNLAEDRELAEGLAAEVLQEVGKL